MIPIAASPEDLIKALSNEEILSQGTIKAPEKTSASATIDMIITRMGAIFKEQQEEKQTSTPYQYTPKQHREPPRTTHEDRHRTPPNLRTSGPTKYCKPHKQRWKSIQSSGFRLKETHRESQTGKDEY